MAGDPNPVARELWNGPILRGFHKDDGRRRFFDVWEQLRPLETPSGERHKVFPADDPRFLRVLRKIVRGLHYYHELWNPVPDDMVYVDVLRFAIPAEFLDAMTSHHRESDIFQYQFETFDSFDDIPMSSAWILRFFENREFIALVWKPTNVSRESAQQIVGRERRERVSRHDSSGDA